MRKILHHLKSEWYKYVLEILVITIGILGAYALNSWNEGRNAKKLEIQILGELKKDLEQNLKEISGIRNGIAGEISGGEKLLNFLESDSEELDSIRSYVDQLNRAGIFNNANTTYKNLENIGGNLFSDDSLRIRITILYEQDFQNILTREGVYYDDYRPRKLEHFWQHFKRSKYVGGARFNPYLESLNTPINLEELRRNQVFSNMIFGVTNFRRTRLRFLDRTIADLEQLIIDVERTLEVAK